MTKTDHVKKLYGKLYEAIEELQSPSLFQSLIQKSKYHHSALQVNNNSLMNYMLPADAWNYIGSFIRDFKDVVSLSSTCRSLYHIIHSSDTFWQDTLLTICVTERQPLFKIINRAKQMYSYFITTLRVPSELYLVSQQLYREYPYLNALESMKYTGKVYLRLLDSEKSIFLPNGFSSVLDMVLERNTCTTVKKEAENGVVAPIETKMKECTKSNIYVGPLSFGLCYFFQSKNTTTLQQVLLFLQTEDLSGATKRLIVVKNLSITNACMDYLNQLEQQSNNTIIRDPYDTRTAYKNTPILCLHCDTLDNVELCQSKLKIGIAGKTVNRVFVESISKLHHRDCSLLVNPISAFENNDTNELVTAEQVLQKLTPNQSTPLDNSFSANSKWVASHYTQILQRLQKMKHIPKKAFEEIWEWIQNNAEQYTLDINRVNESIEERCRCCFLWSLFLEEQIFSLYNCQTNLTMELRKLRTKSQSLFMQWKNLETVQDKEFYTDLKEQMFQLLMALEKNISHCKSQMQIEYLKHGTSCDGTIISEWFDYYRNVYLV